MKLVQNGSIMRPATTARHFTVMRAIAYAHGRDSTMQMKVVAADIHMVRHTISLYGVRSTAFQVSSVMPDEKPPSASGAWKAMQNTMSVGMTKNNISQRKDGSVVSISE